MRTSVRLAAFWGLLTAATGHPSIDAQEIVPVDFSQVTRPVVEVSDSAAIDFLLFELFIEPLEPPSRLQVIDVTQNGFGPDDVIISYPSAEAFLIPEFLPDTVQAVMSGWEPEVEYRMDSGNMPSDALAALIGSEPDDATRAEGAIMYDLVQAVERSYRDLPVALLFRRDSVGFTFQLWDYNREAMSYTARPAFASDSAVTSVLRALQDVGYVPGENRVGLGVSLESQGAGVATVHRALLGVTGLADEQMKALAVRTVLLGSYDRDRSGAIDLAREVDAPPCEVWSVLEGAFPDFLDELGFRGAGPYLGNVALSIARNVREPASRRAEACLRGEEPPRTSPAEVAAADSAETPEPVQRFAVLSTAAAIVRRAGAYEAGSADWSQAVRGELLDRFDGDRSGSLDQEAEIRAIGCDVWEAVSATHPAFLVEMGFRGGLAYRGHDIGVTREGRPEVLFRAETCSSNAVRTTFVRVPAGRTGDVRLPPDAIRASVTTPLRGLAGVPEEERRYLPAKTLLLAVFDLDRSGSVDSAAELDAIPCEVWDALDTAFPNFAERFGFSEPSPSVPYRGNIALNISDRLRGSASRRMSACASGRPPPVTAALVDRPQEARTITVPVELRNFLDLEVAARLVQSAAGTAPGSAAWAAMVRSVLASSYDLDGSGALDRTEEVDEVPCIVWSTIEVTYGAPLEELGFGGRGRFLGETLGVAPPRRSDVAARVSACRS